MPPEIAHQTISEEIIVRKSITILLIKGAWAWLISALLFTIADQVFLSLPQANTALATLPNQNFFNIDTVARLILLFFYGAIILYIVLGWINQYYVIKDNSVSIYSGILAVKQLSYDMEEIDSIKVRQGWLGRLLNVGTIVMKNPKIQNEIALYNIPKPDLIADKIHQLSFRYRKLTHSESEHTH